jgi:hypothetical protein
VSGENERPDEVDKFYRPFLRPLGNMVITFARAEAALTELVAGLADCDERSAAMIAGGDRDKIRQLAKESGFEYFDLEELKELQESLEHFWNAMDERHRLVHDEWWVGHDDEEGVVVGTRGFPRKKGSKIAWDNPTVDQIWELASKFRYYRLVFSDFARRLRDRAS